MESYKPAALELNLGGFARKENQMEDYSERNLHKQIYDMKRGLPAPDEDEDSEQED